MHRCLLITGVLIRLWFSAVATPCLSGRFGENCSGVCHCLHGHEFCDLEDGRCTEGPCKPGWTNSPLCQTECPEGLFGLNCGLSCHCNTVDECNVINGHCSSNECAKGWIGPSCQNRMPVLSAPPVVISINQSQVTLAWAAYVHSSDNISIASYDVQWRSEADDNWVDVDPVPFSSDMDVYSFTIRELDLNQNYKFRVRIVWLNSNKRQRSEPSPETEWVHIACREPTGTAGSLNVAVVNKRRDTLKISWSGPVDDSGCERYGWLVINVTCSPQCESVSHKVALPASSTFIVVSQRNRSITTTVTVKVQAFNNVGLGSQRVSTYRVRLLPNAHYDSADNYPAVNEEIKLGVSSVAIENAITSEYVTSAPDITTNDTADIANITEHEPIETKFNAAAGVIDMERSDALNETESALVNDTGHLFDVTSEPFRQLSPSRMQQKRYQLWTRSQNMMSFREIPSEQSSVDSTGALEVTAREVDSLYAVISSDSPGTTIDSSISIVISNLNAGTLYQVDVSSTLSNSSEAVLVYSARHWTLLHSPPKLSRPEVVDIGNTSITLKANMPSGIVKRSFTNVGITYGIQVVVEMDLNRGSRFKALTESSDVLVHDSVAASSQNSQLKDFRSKGTTPYYVALELADGQPKDGVIVVGDGKIYGKQGEYYNVPLVPDARYWLWIGLTSSFDGVIQLALTPLEYPIHTVGTMLPNMMLAAADNEGGGDGGGGGISAGSVAAIVLALILVFLIICLLAIWWFKYKEIIAEPRATTSIADPPTYRPSSELTDKNLDKVFADETPVPVPVAVTVPVAVSGPVVEVPTEPKTTQQTTFDPSFYVMKANHPISVTKLRHHYETHLRPNSHYALQDEFRRLPDGLTDVANVANLPYNVSLNRSQAIVPYDKNRVKLARLHPNDSTYINASYIRTIGYRSCIITQCPMASTANEFWRMVWELRVGTIVMLIETREANGSEFYHYWPKKSKPIYYRDVKVQLMREDKLAHHEVREFRLSCTSEKVEVRRVVQWQYVQWRPGGIPDHPIPFLSMVAAIQEEHDPESGFVIHCLKGGGRSGVYAAVDALVNEGKQSGKVDVLECVTLLRLERVNLVKSLKQYRFVYHCLIEAFNCHETRTPVHRFHFMLANLLARNELDSLTRFEKEYSAVQLECHAVRPLVLGTSSGTRFSGAGTRFYSPDYKEMEGSEGARKMNDGTRNYVVLPSEKSTTPATVQLDGCFTRDAFILSSPPDKARLEKFWEMIDENNASCIVMLNKAEDLPFAEHFLPDDGSSVNCGRYTVHCDSVLIHPNSSFYVHNLIIVNNNNNNNNNNSNNNNNNDNDNNNSMCESVANSIRLYEFAKWPNSLEVPLVDAVLDLTINVSDWNHRVGGGRPAALFSIHGGDKARAALFSIIWMTIDPIQYDGVVDVYSAARYVYSYMPIAITSMEQYHFLYCVMEEHVIRIETQKWRPEKVSATTLPSALLRPCTSDGNGGERLHPRKPGKRRKRLKQLPSDGCSSLSLQKKKRDSKHVTMDGNVSTDDSASDCNRDIVVIKRKLETCLDIKRYSPTASAAESYERWQSPDKTGQWPCRDVKKNTSADAKGASMKKFDALSPAMKLEDDWKNWFGKQVLPPAVKQVEPEAKTVAPKVVKYEPAEMLQFYSSDRRLRTQPEVREPSIRSPVGTKELEPPSTPVDVHERSPKVVQRKPSPTGPRSDELATAPKKTPVTSPASRMTCKCKLVSSSTGGPQRLQCKCKLKCDSAHSDVSDKQRPAFETGAISTAARPATAEGGTRSRKGIAASPNYEECMKTRSKHRSAPPSDEDRLKCPDRPLTSAEKGRRGLSPGRGKPGRRFMGASSSDEDGVAAVGRRGQSPKRSGSKQPGILFKKTSSSLERRVQRKSPPRVGKRSQRFDEKECRSVSPIKRPSGAKKDVNSRTRLSNEAAPRRYPSARNGGVTAAQPVQVGPMILKERNEAYLRATRNPVPDQSQSKSIQERLQQSTVKSPVDEIISPHLSPTEKKSPSVCTSSLSDDIDNLSIGPKLKPQGNVVTRSQAEDVRVRRGRSPIRSASPKFTRTPCLRNGNAKGPRGRSATDSKTEATSLGEKPESSISKIPHIQDQIPPSQEPPCTSKRRKVPPALSKQGECSPQKSQIASERRGRRTLPVHSGSSPKTSRSPAQSPLRRNKSPRQWTADQTRSKRSPSRKAASPKRSRLSSRSSSWDRSSENCPPDGEKLAVETRKHLEVLRPASRSNQRQTARPLGKSFETADKDQTNSAKGPPPKDETTFLVDTTRSTEVDGKEVLSSAHMLSTKPEKSKIIDEDQSPPKQEASQYPKHFHQTARANPSNVGCEIKQKVLGAETLKATGNIDEVHSTLKPSWSDLSIDTRITVERAQAQLEQKNSKIQDLKSETKPQMTGNELPGAKQAPQMYANENAPQGAIPATKDVNTPSSNEETTPCSKISAKAPVQDLSFDELLEGLFYSSSVVSAKTIPSTEARQACEAGLGPAGPSKAVDSSPLSPGRNTGIPSASPKSDSSPALGATQAACCSASLAVKKGFQPSDPDIPYIDDTDSGSAQEWLQK